jgi:hypothetical protein
VQVILSIIIYRAAAFFDGSPSYPDGDYIKQSAEGGSSGEQHKTERRRTDMHTIIAVMGNSHGYRAFLKYGRKCSKLHMYNSGMLL